MPHLVRLLVPRLQYKCYIYFHNLLSAGKLILLVVNIWQCGLPRDKGPLIVIPIVMHSNSYIKFTIM